MHLDHTAHRRFMDSIVSYEKGKCWEWTGTTNNAGYPLFSYQRRMVSALKVLYHLYYKRKIPKGWILTHTCREASCMNPDHVYITTRSELTTELYASGQLKPASQKGAKNPNAKLTEDEVRAIRHRKEAGATHMELAEEYGVTKTTISMIHNRKLWTHVD